MDIIFRSKRHWLSSVLIVVGNAFFLSIFIAIYYFTPEITEKGISSFLNNFGFSLSNETLSTVILIKNIALISLLVYAILNTIYHVFLNYKLEYIVHSDGVTIKSGILPWKKLEWHYTPYQIYKASYSTSFLAWLFNFGTIHIEGTEGVTSRRSEHMMSNAKKLQAEINNLIDTYKQGNNQLSTA